MQKRLTTQEIDQTAILIRGRSHYRPKIAIVLGSGLGELADEIEQADIIPYHEIPCWPVSTVAGHSGKIVIGILENHPVLVLQGRSHFYEGYSMEQVTFPIRVMQRLGIEILIMTNAAGAVNQDYKPGDLMLISDHIGFIPMAGFNPLRGINFDEFGPRFPDMSQVYDRQLITLAEKVAEEKGIFLQRGVYFCLAGPSYETPAELRFLKTIGADVVGMSTVPETIVARHGGTRILAISGVTNKASLTGDSVTTHEEVLETGAIIMPKMAAIIRGMLCSL